MYREIRDNQITSDRGMKHISMSNEEVYMSNEKVCNKKKKQERNKNSFLTRVRCTYFLIIPDSNFQFIQVLKNKNCCRNTL